MSPSLATCLTVPFIIWLLHRDRSRNPPVSPGLWVPTIWVAIAASKPVVSWLTPDASAADNTYLDGTPIDRNVTIASNSVRNWHTRQEDGLIGEGSPLGTSGYGPFISLRASACCGPTTHSSLSRDGFETLETL